VLADIGPGLDNCTFIGNRLFVSHITGSVHEILAPGKVRALVEKGMQWPLGLAVAPDGTLFIADGGFTYTLAPGGKPQLVGMLFTQGFPGWVRAAVASAPGEYVVTTANGTVNRWRPAALENETLSTGHGILMGVALALGGIIVFADKDNGRVLSLVRGETSELASGLDRPMGIAAAPDGTVYVTEAGAGRVLKLSGGRKETLADSLGDPQGIVVSGSNLYVIDVKNKELIEIPLAGGARRIVASNLPVGAPAGVIPRMLGGVGDMCGPMHTFTGVAAGPDGTIYVSGDGEGSVLALRPR
jgi:sugar lactone lactonase YvrE